MGGVNEWVICGNIYRQIVYTSLLPDMGDLNVPAMWWHRLKRDAEGRRAARSAESVLKDYGCLRKAIRENRGTIDIEEEDKPITNMSLDELWRDIWDAREDIRERLLNDLLVKNGGDVQRIIGFFKRHPKPRVRDFSGEMGSIGIVHDLMNAPECILAINDPYTGRPISIDENPDVYLQHFLVDEDTGEMRLTVRCIVDEQFIRVLDELNQLFRKRMMEARETIKREILSDIQGMDPKIVRAFERGYVPPKR